MFKLFRLGKVDSTNTYAMENFKHECVFISTEQTKGQGRNGNKWIENDGSLAMSFCIENDKQYMDGMMTQTLALALCNTVKGALIKWPNDVMLNDKKLAGILGQRDGKKLVIGIGINVNNKNFATDIKNKATSVLIETGEQNDVVEFATKVIKNFMVALKTNNNDKINNMQWLSGKQVFVNGVEYKFDGIDNVGLAMLTDSNGKTNSMMPSEISLSNTYNK